ncbi:MAG: hypothetical protein ABGW84_04080 [Sphingomonadaceae bacterium]
MARSKKIGTLPTSEFTKFGKAMSVIAEKSPHRMSVSQVIFFVEAGRMCLAGEEPTFTSIKEAIGEEVNRSLKTTYLVFFEPTDAYPTALGWLKRVTNPSDKRQKIFQLTKKGRVILAAVLEPLEV